MKLVTPRTGHSASGLPAPAPKERGLNLPLLRLYLRPNGQFQFYPNFVLGGTPGSPTLEHLNWLRCIGKGSGFDRCRFQWRAGSDIQDISSLAWQAPGTLSKQRIQHEFGVSHECQYTTGYVYADTQGGRHPLNMQYTATCLSNANACGYFEVPSGISIAGDGTVTGVLDPNKSRWRRRLCLRFARKPA